MKIGVAKGPGPLDRSDASRTPSLGASTASMPVNGIQTGKVAILAQKPKIEARASGALTELSAGSFFFSEIDMTFAQAFFGARNNNILI